MGGGNNWARAGTAPVGVKRNYQSVPSSPAKGSYGNSFGGGAPMTPGLGFGGLQSRGGTGDGNIGNNIFSTPTKQRAGGAAASGGGGFSPAAFRPRVCYSSADFLGPNVFANGSPNDDQNLYYQSRMSSPDASPDDSGPGSSAKKEKDRTDIGA